MCYCPQRKLQVDVILTVQPVTSYSLPNRYYTQHNQLLYTSYFLHNLHLDIIEIES